jgi:16S rRNA (uracil1498-N3)-methyltransferase
MVFGKGYRGWSSEIVPLLCARTERQRFRHDRMQAILISAMLQSQQCWLPLLHEPTPV